MQAHLFEELVGRGGRAGLVDDGFARNPPPIAATLHAREIADDLGQPRPHRPIRIRLAAPRRDPRLLDEVVRVVAVVREPGRERLQPGGILEHQLRTRHRRHDPILSPVVKALPTIAADRLRQGYSFSPFFSMSTNFARRRTRVSGFFASCSR